MEIKNKVFAITGAGSGLGMATVEHILSRGGMVMAIDHSKEGLDLLDHSPRVLSKHLCDVSQNDLLTTTLRQGQKHWGHIHGGIHCAGIAPAAKIYSKTKGSHSGSLFEKVISINLLGSFYFVNAITPILLENEPEYPDGERGCIILTSSVASYEGQIGQVAYAASKGGVNAMILPAARELASHGIRINAIAPGIFKTAMVDSFPDKVQADLAAQIPFPHRLGKPSEYGQLVISILTNVMINGSVIRLDGAVRMT
ncbi:SDR family NAD(P)-dependent oxidoreductase [Membranihabitans marinus]|uniref:SDR family NAD(P)-dependent oxidoreductase n=1 Tax=Membranihabitans marinus TaxID=1227546 RepID=UPI001F37D568|nr:SDR family NAD(P)-dependent oxidoreductase [Membranihabitans marinus]